MGISNIVLCEDDSGVRSRIKEVLADLLVFHNLKIDILEFPTYKRAEKFIKSKEYLQGNLFILDIELGDEKTGINLGREIRSLDCYSKIIYLSSHIDKSYDVFKYSLDISDFIEKNMEFEVRLRDSISKCFKEFIDDNEKRIVINAGSIMYNVKMSEIIYIETLNRTKKLRLVTDDKMIEFYGTLNDMIKELDDRFMLAHRANIVNLNSVSEINLSYSSANLTLHNGKRCLLSRSKIKEVKSIFEKI